MRIIAGRFGGRNFESPRTHRTHPMSDKIRGALFNALGDINGLSVLDAYSGSGALAIEAVSRGAKSVLAIDVDVDAIKTIADNVKNLKLDEFITVRRKNISGWTRNNKGMQFDIVLCDPPYDDIRPNILQFLVANTAPGGLYVLSWPGNETVREFKDLDLVQAKAYGDAQLVFYRKRV